MAFLTRSYTRAAATVTAGAALATLPSTMFGLIVQPWDPHSNSAATAAAVAALKPSVIRFGGTYFDKYNWYDNDFTAGQSDSRLPFNQASTSAPGGYYANVFSALNVGAGTGQPRGVVTLDYGCNATSSSLGGDWRDGANWISNANKNNAGWQTSASGSGGLSGTLAGHTGLISVCGVGNEQYLATSGLAPNQWGSKGAAGYLANAPNFITGAKAIDSTVKCLIPLQADTPGNASFWNSTILSDATMPSLIDGVEIHCQAVVYPTETDWAVLTYADQIAQVAVQIKNELQTYCPTQAARLSAGLWFDALNLSLNNPPSSQTSNIQAALYLADCFLALMQQGVANLSWYILHFMQNTTGSIGGELFGPNQYGNFGILSSGGTLEPAVDVPTPAYFGAQMITSLIAPGDVVVASSCPGVLVRCYAVKRASDGKLVVYFINRDFASKVATLTLSGAGFTPADGSATLFLYDETFVSSTPGATSVPGIAQSSIAAGALGVGSPYRLPLTPLSLTALVIN